MKAVVAAFNQEKALVGAFSVIVQLHRLIDLRHYQAIVGCGDNPLPCADDSCSAPPPDCYTFNMEQGWRKIASPGRPYSPLASGALVNGNGILYYIEDLGSVYQYSTEEDQWTKIGEDISRRSCILNTRCVLYLVNDGLFACSPAAFRISQTSSTDLIWT